MTMTLQTLNKSLKLRNLVGLSRVISRQTSLSIAQIQQNDEPTRTDQEWLNAKSFDSMPGPSKMRVLLDYLPSGELYNTDLETMPRILRQRYGDIFVFKGLFGKPDTVFTFNPRDYEITYRNEGIWPIRIGLFTFEYYRKVKRPDVFQGIGGLVTEQGKEWGDIRNKVNPILMKVQNIRHYVPEIDEIAAEFVTRLETLRDPKTGAINADFIEEIKMWAFESISLIALNTRLGVLKGQHNEKAHKLAENMSIFFQLSFEYDLMPSFWRYFETSGFKRLMKAFDNITDINISYIEAAMKKFDEEKNVEAKSVLEKLCRLDKRVAVIMAMDMLMAGMDTTSSAFMTTLYNLARHPDKQEALRRELLTFMPTPDTKLNEANTKNMPYLRACIKEALRLTPITPANYRITVKDLVLSGYRVPKGTGVSMSIMDLSNDDKYFPRSDEFLPERWLKSGESACPAARNTNPFVYLPFGFGPRTCIGKRIAEMEIETLLARLVRNYKITWDSEEKLNYVSNIVLTPKGKMHFKFEKLQ